MIPDEAAKASLMRRRREAKRAYAGNEPILQPMPEHEPIVILRTGPTEDEYQTAYLAGYDDGRAQWWSWRSFFLGALTLAVLTALVLWKIA